MQRDVKKRTAGGAQLLTNRTVEELRRCSALAELVDAMRQREEDLSRCLQSTDPHAVHLACRQAVCELLGDEWPNDAHAARDPWAFAREVFALRGTPKTASRRREARKAARSFAHLSAGTLLVPRCAQDFRRLWELAMEGEPRLSEDWPTSAFRTSRSAIRDTHEPFGYLYMNTNPANIVGELEELAAFLRDESLLPELRGAAGYASCMLTHPFDDGNGHTGRMLMLAMMAPSYSLLTNVCFARTFAVRRADLGNAMVPLREGTGTLVELCRSALELLCEAHREAAALLESAQRRS